MCRFQVLKGTGSGRLQGPCQEPVTPKLCSHVLKPQCRNKDHGFAPQGKLWSLSVRMVVAETT